MNDKNYTSTDGELWEAKKPNRSFKSKDGELWECEETEETRKATQKLHEDIRKLEREKHLITELVNETTYT